MNIAWKNATLTLSYLLGDHVLSNVTWCKYLGIIITNNVKWNLHTNIITWKAYEALWYLKWNLRHTSMQVKLTAYKTYVHLILEYADIVWDLFINNILQLERLQRKGLHFIYDKYRHLDSVSEPYSTSTTDKLLLVRADDNINLHCTHSFRRHPSTDYPSRHLHNLSFFDFRIPIDAFEFLFFPKGCSREELPS